MSQQVNQDQINIRNESALDLLVTQNKAKSTLATNLQGIGISANANTETLNELAYKVSNAVVDNSRQKIESIAIGSANNGSDGRDFYTVKNNWYFHIDSNRTLYYQSLESIKAQTSDDYGGHENFNRLSIENFVSEVVGTNNNRTLIFSEDGQYLFIIGNYVITRYPVNWGTNNSSVSFGSKVVLTPKYNNNDVSNIFSVDVAADGSKLLIFCRVNIDWDSYIMLLKFDLSNISEDTTQNCNAYAGFINAESSNFLYTETDNQICQFIQDGELYTFYLYNVDTTTLDMSIISDKTTTIQSANYTSSYWKIGFNKFKDLNNRYRIIFALNLTSDTDSFAIFDSYNKILECYKSGNSWGGFRQYNQPVVVYVNNNKYYIFSGQSILIFNSNWNLLGNVYVKCGDYAYFNTPIIYDGDAYCLYDGLQNVDRVKIYFNKQLAYSRIVSIVDKPTKQLVYYAQPTETEIEDGYYD